MIGHELHRSGSFWSFLLSIDKDLADSIRQKDARAVVASTSPTTRGHRGAGRIICRRSSLPVQLLLRSRWMQEKVDTAVGAFSRQKGLPWCNGDRDQCHAARSDAAASPRGGVSHGSFF